LDVEAGVDVGGEGKCDERRWNPKDGWALMSSLDPSSKINNVWLWLVLFVERG
jgi:hypothetical protein